jgi:N-acetyl-beta-hexosaminidase
MKPRQPLVPTLAPAVFLALLATGCAGMRAAPGPAPRFVARYPIVPAPRHLEAKPGEFRLDRETRIVLSDPRSRELRTLAELLAAPLRAAAGLPLPVASEPAADQAPNAISIRLTPSPASSDPESYRLLVSECGATLSAPTPAGLYLGLETLRQLLPPELEGGVHPVNVRSRGVAATKDAAPPAPARWVIPAVDIEDAPRFRYRGILLDVARWYYPPEFIEKVIDLLALYKLNTLHLHLTDDQGWRLEIRKYPRLRGGRRRSSDSTSIPTSATARPTVASTLRRRCVGWWRTPPHATSRSCPRSRCRGTRGRRLRPTRSCRAPAGRSRSRPGGGCTTTSSAPASGRSGFSRTCWWR